MNSSPKKAECDLCKGSKERKIDLNNDKHVYHVKVVNAGDALVGWAVKALGKKRLGVEAPCGVLSPKKAILLAVPTDWFVFAPDDTDDDRIVVKYVKTPAGVTEQDAFSYEWFQDDSIVQRKNLPSIQCASPIIVYVELEGEAKEIPGLKTIEFTS
ncbi:MSP (Major sperm protein) domain-containing protein [Ditylenchus destructor]|uniref:Major sperm protein n=1 Tax=Ditylenchus destructor TaxID=166010 RepID=A0AAD4N8Z0_9BILA|nr:MSP (Major sperm protein) domain-containing protein [Ditylenchus destructor]